MLAHGDVIRESHLAQPLGYDRLFPEMALGVPAKGLW
jgi:hypothetical protein